MGKIKILGNGFPKTTGVLLDDMNISRFVKAIHVDIDVERAIPVVHLTLIGDVELPDELKAIVKATQQEKKSGRWQVEPVFGRTVIKKYPRRGRPKGSKNKPKPLSGEVVSDG